MPTSSIAVIFAFYSPFGKSYFVFRGTISQMTENTLADAPVSGNASFRVSAGTATAVGGNGIDRM
jgi:hypothetical protein